MISAYERDKRQPTVATLMRLLKAAGFELRMQLAPIGPDDEVLDDIETGRSRGERHRRDRQLSAWRQAPPLEAASPDPGEQRGAE
jgi:transcriptional regulator with XRE-family HTH domain